MDDTPTSTPTTFELYIKSEIEPLLSQLEKNRKTFFRITYVVAFLVVAMLIYFTSLQQWVVTLLSLSLLVVAYFIIDYYIQLFRRNYKSQIINKVLEFIRHEHGNIPLYYEPRGSIHPTILKESKIFFDKKYIVKGEDYISGTINNKNFEFSELRLLRQRWEKTFLFKGWFLRKETINIQHDNLSLMILPTHSKNHYIATIKKYLHEGAKEVVLISDPNEQQWSCYTTLPEDHQAFRLQNIAQIIGSLSQFYHYGTIAYFHHQQLYLALYDVPDILEPVWWKPLMSEQSIKQYYFDLNKLINSIVSLDIVLN
ncbi:MAG: hypothetical protein KBA06_03095 [Saprospiraceae bacterium]|nr:hypothetical protein [Saprospiraceae bacterium]